MSNEEDDLTGYELGENNVRKEVIEKLSKIKEKWGKIE